MLRAARLLTANQPNSCGHPLMRLTHMNASISQTQRRIATNNLQDLSRHFMAIYALRPCGS